jgi:hypothetical protein
MKDLSQKKENLLKKSNQNASEKIYRESIDGKINHSEAIHRLIIIVENSDSNQVRADILEIINYLGLKYEKEVKLIENFLISDESEQVREVAAKIIAQNFEKYPLELFIWVIKNETSVKVVKKLIDYFEAFNENISKILQKKIIKRYSRLYDIIKEEAEFFWDFDKILSDKIGNLEINSNFFAIYKYFSEFPRDPISAVYSNPFPSIAIVKRHVIALNIKNSKLEEIPDSIKCLSKLKYLNLSYNKLALVPDSIGRFYRLTNLNLSDNKLSSIPNTFESLYRLKNFDLSYNSFNGVPEVIKVISKRRIAWKYIKKGVALEEFYVLGLIEILSGQKLAYFDDPMKFKEFTPRGEMVNENMLPQYKIDDNGHILKIYTCSFQGNDLEKIPSEVLNEIRSLKYLKELYLNSYKIL